MKPPIAKTFDFLQSVIPTLQNVVCSKAETMSCESTNMGKFNASSMNLNAALGYINYPLIITRFVADPLTVGK